MHVRLLASILAAGLVIATAIGCGADPAPVRPAHTSITRHRAQAVARMITIRAADLPEFKATAHPATAQESSEAAHQVNCARPAGRRGLAHRAPSARRGRTARRARHSGHRVSRAPRGPWASARSDRISAGSGYHALGASSNVSIMPTSAAARLEVAASEHLDQTCMEHALRAEVTKEHLRLPLRGVVVEPFSVNVPGADAGVAYRAIVAYRGAPLILYIDSIVFAYGQDLIELTTYHASKPVPSAMEERLLGLLVARARAHAR
jgi:hypothetical protein